MEEGMLSLFSLIIVGFHMGRYLGLFLMLIRLEDYLMFTDLFMYGCVMTWTETWPINGSKQITLMYIYIPKCVFFSFFSFFSFFLFSFSLFLFSFCSLEL